MLFLSRAAGEEMVWDRQWKTTIRNGCTFTWAEFKKGNIDLIYEGEQS
jgi:hypothetical protein